MSTQEFEDYVLRTAATTEDEDTIDEVVPGIYLLAEWGREIQKAAVIGGISEGFLDDLLPAIIRDSKTVAVALIGTHEVCGLAERTIATGVNPSPEEIANHEHELCLEVHFLQHEGFKIHRWRMETFGEATYLHSQMQREEDPPSSLDPARFALTHNVAILN